MEQIEAALLGLAPSSVRSAVRPVTDGDELSLFPVELEVIRRASPTRRRQFATGRVLLRQLLGSDVEIPAAPDRRPVLPHGVIASLAHDDQVAVAVASDDQHFVGLGIDLERDAAITPDLVGLILRDDDAIADPALAFVVKEAAYKAWSRPGRPILDHLDVRISGDDPRALVATVVPTTDHVALAAVRAANRWIAVAVQRRR